MAVRRLAFKWRQRVGIVLTLACFLAPGLSTPAAASIELGDYRPIQRPPPPPPSPYMSEQDFMTLDAAFEAVRVDNWQDALNLANQLEDTVGRDLIRWLWVQDSNGEAPFAAIIRFLSEHPTWPRQSIILRRAEEALPDEMPSEQVVAWFAGNEPVTGNGKLRLASAYLELGNQAFATHWVREAWVNHDFSSRQERRLLSSYGDYIDDATHIQRAERLLWAHEYSTATRMRSRVPSDFRRLMDAWLSLMARESNASSRVRAVPENYQNHPGLLYERIRWRRRKSRDEETWPMLAAAPTTAEELGEPSRWWTERHIQSRNALRDGFPQEAYDMVAGHGMTSGGDFAEAEWLAGWIALRFLDHPADALGHFETLAAGVSYPISSARAYYWMGRAAEELGQTEDAQAHYSTAATHPTTYYGQLAMERIGPNGAVLNLPEPPLVDPAHRETFRNEELVHAAELLSDVASERLQFAWFLHLGDYYDDPAELQIIADMAREFGEWHMAVRVGKLAMFQHIYLTETTYPLVEYNDLEADLVLPEMGLVLGLSRQESEFNPRARSGAGAYGLMQLMPNTARSIARNMGLLYNRSWLTENPSYNTELGRYHLGELLARYDGSYIMTMAAYNAGPHRVTQWVERYGDPRTGEVDPIDWVEMLPFRETRNYIQRVLENTMVYRNRLTGYDLEVTMTADLARGGGQPPVMLASLPQDEIDGELGDDEILPRVDGDAPIEPSESSVMPLEDVSNILETPSEGNRVVIQVNAADRPTLRGTPSSEHETLLEPEVHIWTAEPNCAAYVPQANGDREGSCEDS